MFWVQLLNEYWTVVNGDQRKQQLKGDRISSRHKHLGAPLSDIIQLLTYVEVDMEFYWTEVFKSHQLKKSVLPPAPDMDIQIIPTSQTPLLENRLNIKYLYIESEKKMCVIACYNFSNVVQTFRTRELCTLCTLCIFARLHYIPWYWMFDCERVKFLLAKPIL